MNVDSLQHGRKQPFYHVLPDTRDRPGAQVCLLPSLALCTGRTTIAGAPQVMYVAQENIVLDTPSEPLLHPLINEMFSDFDVERGQFNPNPALSNDPSS